MKAEAAAKSPYNLSYEASICCRCAFISRAFLRWPPAAGFVSGAYVEARTAEVFTGGCIMNSEAETMGKQAVLAWKVDRGSFNGVAIDGLSVVAALSGDRNLGMTEMGGEQAGRPLGDLRRTSAPTPRSGWRWSRWPTSCRSGLIGTIVQVTPRADSVREIAAAKSRSAPRRRHPRRQQAPQPRLRPAARMQWFHPFSNVDARDQVGVADAARVHRIGTRHEVERPEQEVGVLRNASHTDR